MTLYDILGLLPSASAEKIRRAYQARMRLLGPEMISGASSKVLAAVDRAQASAEQAWRVLGDPASRERYDRQAGLRSAEGGWTGRRPSRRSRAGRRRARSCPVAPVR